MNNIDLRSLFPPVRDQGVRGTCVAFAATAAHELALRSLVGSFEDLSEEALYWHCKQIDNDQQDPIPSSVNMGRTRTVPRPSAR